MPPCTWRCPVPGCHAGPDGEPWRITETAADVVALEEGHARDRYGELPEPLVLAELRAGRVEQALSEHVSEHPRADIAAWIA